MSPPPNDDIFPAPVFEGSEKRISVTFAPSPILGVSAPPAAGLRSLPRSAIDAMLDLAACQVVSARCTQDLDAYVLSESSLFVYPDRMVLKTCGTTKLLDCLPFMVDIAAAIGLVPARVKYSRASFLFPDRQPEPHHGFEHECEALQQLFGALGTCSAVVLGDALAGGLQWHVFVAGVDPALATAVNVPKAVSAQAALAHKQPPVHTLEVCMTGLCSQKAAKFFRDKNFESAAAVTAASGIAALVPGHAIDDYVFEPCGYSMNAVGMGNLSAEFSTVHITPEDDFSYASFEICGYDPACLSMDDLIAHVVDVFRPRGVSVALSADAAIPGAGTPGWGAAFRPPTTYLCHSASYQEVRCGGFVAYFTMERKEEEGDADADVASTFTGAAANLAHLHLHDACAMPQEESKDLLATNTTKKQHAASCDGDRDVLADADRSTAFASHDGAASSPRAVLKHFPSFGTFKYGGSSSSHGDADGTGSSGSDRGPSDIELLAASSDNSSDCGLSAGGTAEHLHLLRSRPLDGPLPLAFDDVVATHAAVPLPRGDVATIDAHVRDLIRSHNLEDNFYVVDLGLVQRLWRAWSEAMPRVHPHYAVKCNNDRALLRALAALGAGFDCASEAEVEQVLDLGVSPERIVFANPCKRPADIRAAMRRGVWLSTFDTEAELMKLCRWAPGSRVLLRIRADDPTARCPLGNKFGAEEWEWEQLFAAARRLGVPVDGVSFHVGSGATNPIAFSYAIEAARRAFDLGAAYGFDMTMLDIGGGFCGGRFDAEGRVDLGGVPAAVNDSLAAHFPESSGVRVIAEPGRYFAESVATLATLLYGRRQRTVPGAGASATTVTAGSAAVTYDYWVTDGLYGSMNCLLYDHATIAPRALPVVGVDAACWSSSAFSSACNAGVSGAILHGGIAEEGGRSSELYPSTVFGPTCDGLDTVVRDFPLPEMHVGDWLVWPRMGAYTLCGASKFNGVNAVDVPTFYVCSARA